MTEKTKAAPGESRAAFRRIQNAHSHHNGIEGLLSHLDKVRQTGPGRWSALCPAHDDKAPSLSIRELNDGRVLLHCFAGCNVHEVLSSIGLEMDALFPSSEGIVGKPERRPFPACDVLRALAFEAVIVMLVAKAVRDQKPVSPADYDRLFVAVCRIQDGLNAAGVIHRV